MSTKNLARTVIEGGRHRASSWARRSSNQMHRRDGREACARVANGADYDAAVYPKRLGVYRMFHDKLGPAERWLASKVGRSWNKTRSELFARFDTRTTAGRHILFDHILPEVAVGDGRFLFRRPEYRVDRAGVLRKNVGAKK
jgi:hypothetical protein